MFKMKLNHMLLEFTDLRTGNRKTCERNGKDLQVISRWKIYTLTIYPRKI